MFASEMGHSSPGKRAIRTLLLGALIGMGLAETSSAQQVVQLTINPPPPNQITIADLWSLQIVNLGRAPIQVYLRGTVTEERDGLVADAETSVITLRPGLNRMTGRRVEPVDVSYEDKKYERALTRTGQAPSGDYELCVEAIDENTGGVLGSDCIFHEVMLLSPPELISPIDGEVVTNPLPLFTWTPPAGMQVVPSQTKVIVMQIYGRQSPLEAVRSNPAWFEGTARGTSLQYPSAAKRFQQGRYAWMVTVLSGVGRDRGADALAQSDVGYFEWKPRRFPIIPVVIQIIPGIPNAISEELLASCSGDIGPLAEKDIIVTSQGGQGMRIVPRGGVIRNE